MRDDKLHFGVAFDSGGNGATMNREATRFKPKRPFSSMAETARQLGRTSLRRRPLRFEGSTREALPDAAEHTNLTRRTTDTIMFNFRVSHRTGTDGQASSSAADKTPARGQTPSSSNTRPHHGPPLRPSSIEVGGTSSMPPRLGLDHARGMAGNAFAGRLQPAQTPVGRPVHGHGEAGPAVPMVKRSSPEEVFEGRLQWLLQSYSNRERAAQIAAPAHNGNLGVFRAVVEEELKTARSDGDKKMLNGLLSSVGRVLGDTPPPVRQPVASSPELAARFPAAAPRETPPQRFDRHFDALTQHYPNESVTRELTDHVLRANFSAFGQRLVEELNQCADPAGQALLKNVLSATKGLKGDYNNLKNRQISRPSNS